MNILRKTKRIWLYTKKQWITELAEKYALKTEKIGKRNTYKKPSSEDFKSGTLLNKDFTPTGDGSESNSAPTQSSPDYPSDR